MNIRTTQNSGERPPIDLTSDECRAISQKSIVHPFRVGDVVAPKTNLLPINTITFSPHKISKYEKLTVRIVNSKGEQHHIEFNGKSGRYDALFFVKA